MYYYYQVTEKSNWDVIPESKVTDENLKRLKAKKLTILSVSQAVDEFTKKEDLRYKGDLYFDIDCREDLYATIKSARELVTNLTENYDVPFDAVSVFCSGSKGMHVLVDQRAFYNPRPLKHLPAIYKVMARELFVFGLDFQVYSGGRGVSWRLPNVQRDDGKYRVKISIDELMSLTEEKYAEIVASPRDSVVLYDKPRVELTAYRLQSLFERAKIEVNDELKKSDKLSKGAMPESAILGALKGETPRCVEMLVKGKEVDKTKNLNELAMQLAAYAAASGKSRQEVSELFSKFSETSESSTYRTARARYQHVKGLYGYLKSGNRKFTFSCPGIKSTLSQSPCNGCPVIADRKPNAGDHRVVDEGEGVTEKVMESVDIAVRYDGYYAVSGDSERKLSTYTMEVTDYHEEPTQDGTGTRITGYIVMLRIEIDGKMEYREVPISEDAFNSRAALNNELKGIAGAVFYGSDTDAIKLKAFITSDQMRAKANKIITSYVAGVITHNIGKASLNVYVDPDGSINEFKVQGTHYLNSDVQAPPQFFKVGLPEDGSEEVKQVIDNLLDINTELNIACLIGWHTAVHFKSQIMHKYSQFPLLSIWGAASAGKTQTAVKFSMLNGCDYKSRYTPVIASQSTPWALVDYCSTTSTAPRILDEANETKMDRRLYEKFAEVVKASFNGATMPRGSIRKAGSSGRGRTGAVTVSIPITSPCIMISEQAQSMPAIQQRSLEVFLSSKGRLGRRAQFHALNGKEDILMSVGKAMMFKSLETKVEEICAVVEKYIPELDQDLDDRTIFSYAVALAGIEMFGNIMEELGFDYSAKVKSMIATLLEHVNITKRQEIMQNKSRSETDLVIVTMSLMAQMGNMAGLHRIVENEHFYLRNGRDLLIDYKYAFPMYTGYCRKQGEKVIIKNLGQFLTLVREEPYYVDEEPPNGIYPRPMLVLDTVEMSRKGIDPTMFTLDAEIADD